MSDRIPSDLSIGRQVERIGELLSNVNTSEEVDEIEDLIMSIEQRHLDLMDDVNGVSTRHMDSASRCRLNEALEKGALTDWTIHHDARHLSKHIRFTVEIPETQEAEIVMDKSPDPHSPFEYVQEQ